MRLSRPGSSSSGAEVSLSSSRVGREMVFLSSRTLVFLTCRLTSRSTPTSVQRVVAASPRVTTVRADHGAGAGSDDAQRAFFAAEQCAGLSESLPRDVADPGFPVSARRAARTQMPCVGATGRS